VDTPSPKNLPGRWLVLSLLVLLAHLGLLQSMPLALNPGSSVADPAMSFVTRTLAPAPVMPSTVVAAKPRARPVIKPAPRPTPVPPTPVAEPVTGPEIAFGSIDSASTSASSAELLAADGTPQAVGRTEPAAAPEPETPPPVPRPPREKPPSFSLDTLSGSTRLLYKVHANKFPFGLNGELQWRNQGERYSVRLSYSAFGQSRTQTSRGRLTDLGLAPERFSDKYRSEVAAHFDYPQGKVTFSANTPDAPLLSGGQDRLSVLVQLGALVASEPERYGPGTTLTIQTIGPRDADLWLFTFEATETLELPGGSLQGLKLVRNPRQPYDQKVEIWLAANLGYLPARIRITETNGDAIDQQWAGTEPLDSTD